MRLEFLLQFIVPLTFLAIWALTSLLNRDAQPLPPRPGAGRGPGPGPGKGMAGGGFSPSASARGDLARPIPPGRPSPVADRDISTRWTPPSASGRPGAGASRGGDEGIVILDEPPRSAQGPSSFSPSAAASGRTSRGTTSTSRRAASRGRVAPTPPARAAEPERRRTLEGLTAESLGPKRGKGLTLTPLASPIAPMSSVPLSVASLAVPIAAVPGEAPTLSADQIQAMLASPKRLREVALLGELLQPPVSLRGPRRPR